VRQILVVYVYETMLRRAKKEIKRDKEEETTESGDEVTSTGPPVSDEDALRYIFKKKLQGEKEAESTTDDDSWYTESDRNVHLLLDQKRHGSTGCIWGRMILMRVYENQENMTIQTILRDALQKLGLEAPPRPDGKQPARAFSVLSDIAETVIEDAIEPYFLKDHDLRRATAVDSESSLWALVDDRVTELPRDSKAITLSKILADKKFKVEQQVAKGIQMPKAELGYTDLHNLPMLLIVTEKARMGDTFPHSLATLDLRMRTGGTLVAFVQELGRMCRYPFTRKLPIESSCLSCAATPMALPDEVKNHREVTRSFELGLPIIVMPENGKDADIIGHAQNEKELGELVNKLASEYGVGCKFELHGYFDQLPRAIIRTDVMKLLVDGIQVKEQKAPKSDLTTALQCVVMKGGMDDYMKPVKAPKDLIARIDGDNNPWHKYYENFLPAASHQEDSTSSKTVHYDAGPAACAKHKNRLLLFAECQIGKTGAYLHFITRLREEIRGDRLPAVILDKVDTKWGWHFPYWRNLSNAVLDYKQPKEGHYFEKVAQGRMVRLQKLAKEGLMNWASAFCKWLQGHGADEPYGELIVSETGRKKIEELYDKIKDADIPVMPSGCAKEGARHEDVLRSCINWDARMNNVSQLGEKIGDLKDKNYSPANAAFDQVGFAAAKAKTPSITSANAQMPSITWARHQPPACNPADGSLMTRKFTLRKKAYGRNAELCEDADCILHIPACMKDKLIGVDSGTDDLTASFEGLKVKRWIFTCSSGGADKKQIRLNREPAMKPLHRTEYAQVLVVRPDAELESYVRTWGSQYIVVAMPATMAVKYAHDDEKRTLRVEIGRVGYARLFCQLLADALNLEEIWMLDDNVERCFTIEMSGDANVPAVGDDGVVQLRECGFSNVMRGMELLLDQVREFRTLCATSLRV
jgi:hypothetical protein